MIQNKKENFRDFQVFEFALQPRSKTEKPRNLFIQLFETLFNVGGLNQLFSNKNQSVNIKREKNLIKK